MYLSQSKKNQVSHDLLCEPAIASSNHSGGKFGYPCPLAGRGCETPAGISSIKHVKIGCDIITGI